MRLETASRPRCQDRGHISHPHHSEDWCSPKKKWGKPRTEAEPKWHVQAQFSVILKCLPTRRRLATEAETKAFRDRGQD